MTPKLKFRVADFEHIKNPINFFLNPQKRMFNWSRIILKEYPKLNKNLKNIKNIEERHKVIEDFFSKLIKQRKDKFIRLSKKYQKEWDKINDKAMISLQNVTEKKWLEKDKQINVFISPNPICPRYLKYMSFDVFYRCNVKNMKAITFHELLHFIYFEKWKEVFPEFNEKEFESPHLLWKLSEMVPLAVLSDKRVQRVFKHKPMVYKEWGKIKINKKPLLSYIQNFYNNKEDFSDFLKKSYAFVKEHEKIINLKRKNDT